MFSANSGVALTANNFQSVSSAAAAIFFQTNNAVTTDSFTNPLVCNNNNSSNGMWYIGNNNTTFSVNGGISYIGGSASNTFGDDFAAVSGLSFTINSHIVDSLNTGNHIFNFSGEWWTFTGGIGSPNANSYRNGSMWKFSIRTTPRYRIGRHSYPRRTQQLFQPAAALPLAPFRQSRP